eukprot:CAMPEP_0184338866 /NCGR_PEP_ID=MMETSP1089-20130417/7481_1 /TAXON_ID=38269 ORGANISM="Gloeochaete wittrockiana, Strain SAG46.84" /NCGR_SAMPLE_ID=MMETSP1089 /ASSEMBLY_ACC=CAM_ASM_000445 /LENGTH=1055 /DNA_ID=CAMNT_0026665711 /DNA_START=214 /DNA_END=3378 /DNA_ORIENTATION=-
MLRALARALTSWPLDVLATINDEEEITKKWESGDKLKSKKSSYQLDIPPSKDANGAKDATQPPAPPSPSFCPIDASKGSSSLYSENPSPKSSTNRKMSPDLQLMRLEAWDPFQTGQGKGRTSGYPSDVEEQIAGLRREMAEATSYDMWLHSAVKLDVLQGREVWKADAQSPHYDSDIVWQQLRHIRELREDDNAHGLAFSLRTCLYRGFGGTNNPKLHSYTHTGTKYLIDDYVSEMVRALEYVCETPVLPLHKRIEFFNETRHHYGRTALLLSGGASLAMYHFGVVKALNDANLLPRVMSGSSAGAIVAAYICCHTDAELANAFDMGNINLEFFERSGSAARRKLYRFFTKGYFMDINKLQDCASFNLGNVTFQEAYDRTRRILNITVSASKTNQVPQLLNYLTAPNVIIWSAAVASCALPGVFPPVPLMAKDEDGNLVPYHVTGLKWSDGSMETDLPMAKLSEMFNVNHFIVSQVNPHVIPFINTFSNQTNSKWLKVKRLLASEIKHRCIQLAELDMVPRVVSGFLPIVTQRYEGDITIVPSMTMDDYKNIFTNPSKELLEKATLESMRNTWPKLAIIRSHCRVEITLDECWRKLCAMSEARGFMMPAPLRRIPSWVSNRSLKPISDEKVLPHGDHDHDSNLLLPPPSTSTSAAISCRSPTPPPGALRASSSSRRGSRTPTLRHRSEPSDDVAVLFSKHGITSTTDHFFDVSSPPYPLRPSSPLSKLAYELDSADWVLPKLPVLTSSSSYYARNKNNSPSVYNRPQPILRPRARSRSASCGDLYERTLTSSSSSSMSPAAIIRTLSPANNRTSSPVRLPRASLDESYSHTTARTALRPSAVFQVYGSPRVLEQVHDSLCNAGLAVYSSTGNTTTATTTGQYLQEESNMYRRGHYEKEEEGAKAQQDKYRGGELSSSSCDRGVTEREVVCVSRVEDHSNEGEGEGILSSQGVHSISETVLAECSSDMVYNNISTNPNPNKEGEGVVASCLGECLRTEKKQSLTSEMVFEKRRNDELPMQDSRSSEMVYEGRGGKDDSDDGAGCLLGGGGGTSEEI